MNEILAISIPTLYGTIFAIIDSGFYYYFMRYDDIVAKCCGYYVKSEYIRNESAVSCLIFILLY